MESKTTVLESMSHTHLSPLAFHLHLTHLKAPDIANTSFIMSSAAPHYNNILHQIVVN
jgi:hypothetical protein